LLRHAMAATAATAALATAAVTRPKSM